MKKVEEQRCERRLQYHWPIRFANDFDETLFQGQMVDVSSWGGSFTCHADQGGFDTGQRIRALFSVPRFGTDESFDMASYTRVGRICRVENVDGLLHRVAIQFAEPLFFKPGEQGLSQDEAQRRLKSKACV